MNYQILLILGKYLRILKANKYAGTNGHTKAARYYVLIYSSFGADVRSFATGVCNIPDKLREFKSVQERLKRVIIENADFSQILKTYDREETLFYLDPPYFKSEKYYDEEFSFEDHKGCMRYLVK